MAHRYPLWRTAGEAELRAEFTGTPKLDILERETSGTGVATWVRVGKTPLRTARAVIGILGMYLNLGRPGTVQSGMKQHPRTSTCRRFAALASILAIAGPAGALPERAPSQTAVASAPAEPETRIVHAFNRLAYGPRPEDVERVRRIGLDAWIDQQLHPERIADEGIGARLAGLRTVGLSSGELMKGYEVPRAARREIAKKKAEQGADSSEEDAGRMRRELIQKYRGEMAGAPREVVDQLQAAKVLRAVYSERQLDEVLVDFWMNHFNVFANKGQDRFLIGEYEREAIRPHAWGKFEDLLKATAESPAMLFYLDNWLSADPDAAAARGRKGRGAMRRRASGEAMRDPDAPPPGGQQRRRGLNENYAREIMELHTLGVDGGYTQKDVTEVARCFTGWGIRGLRDQRPEFAFDARVHDRKDKVVLGHRIASGGKTEGDEVIHILSTQPATAHFVSLKLARRFVADEPPAALVDRAAQIFRNTDGDIRAVVTAIVKSPEFQAPESRSAKVKTPLEFVVSAVRASGAQVDDARDLTRRIGQMGMPLYQQQPPTGYKDTAEAWVSTGSLLARLNFALDLAGGRVRGVGPLALTPRADTGDITALLATRFVPSGLSESTRRTLDAEAGLDPARMAGLILGSPEFQRR
jgi:uncharacterized protein (DUF1800 family)